MDSHFGRFIALSTLIRFDFKQRSLVYCLPFLKVCPKSAEIDKTKETSLTMQDDLQMFSIIQAYKSVLPLTASRKLSRRQS